MKWISRMGYWYQQFFAGPFWDGRNRYATEQQHKAIAAYLRDHPEEVVYRQAEPPARPGLH